MKYDIKKQLHSFGYAWQGLRSCIGKEQNLNFHLLAAAVAVGMGAGFGITCTEWIAVMLCIGMVIGAELMNTAIERLVDMVCPEQNPQAGRVKDIAAAAVLVCAAASLIVGLIVFLPYLIRLFR